MKSSSVLVVASAVLAVTSAAVAQEPAPPVAPEPAPAVAQPPPTQSNLESGGVKPPEAIDPAPPPAPTQEPTPEKELEEADKEDSGRGLEWFWLNGEVGVQHVGLDTFKDNGLVDPRDIETTQTGVLFGAGVGVRLLIFTAGVRFRMASFTDFKLWTLDAEGGVHIPLGSIEPYANLAVGYASLGSLSGDAVNSPQGANVRVGLGLDWYISNTFTIGANASGDVLFLARSGSSKSSNEVYAEDGTSIGGGVTGTAVVGLHF